MIIIICFFIVADRIFYSSFLKRAEVIRAEASKQNNDLITETDLKRLPEPVARYIRFSGMVGRKRINSMRLVHSGSFRPGRNRQFTPIKGEYSLTTKKPSFCWYGKISLLPGFTAVAFDSYFNGTGRMLVKVMSVYNIVDAQSKEIDLSAFGRCVAEMTMAPTFFLDTEQVKWIYSDSTRAECIVMDSGLSTEAQLFFVLMARLKKLWSSVSLITATVDPLLKSLLARGKIIETIAD